MEEESGKFQVGLSILLITVFSVISILSYMR
jgi:hypothetical protein